MSLKKAYLYLVSVISLVITVIGAIMLINLGLKAWIFTKADRDYYTAPCYSVDAGTGKSIDCSAGEQAARIKEQSDMRTAQRQRDAAQSIAMILVAAPVWIYHWKMARKEV